MAAGADQDQAARLQAVKQQPVEADVAFTVVRAFAGEVMVQVFFRQADALGQHVDHVLQFPRVMAAGAEQFFQVVLEMRGPDYFPRSLCHFKVRFQISYPLSPA